MVQFSADSIASRFKRIILEFPSEILPRKFLTMFLLAQILKFFSRAKFELGFRPAWQARRPSWGLTASGDRPGTVQSTIKLARVQLSLVKLFKFWLIN